MFDYDKWLHPNLKIESGKVAIPAIPATETSKNSKNSGNSDSSQLASKKLDLEKLKLFLSEDWFLYKDNPKALMAWGDLLYEQQLMQQGIVPDSFTDVAYCQSCQQSVYIPPAQVSTKILFGCPWCNNKGAATAIPAISATETQT